jgi:hypothetical protein
MQLVDKLIGPVAWVWLIISVYGASSSVLVILAEFEIASRKGK